MILIDPIARGSRARYTNLLLENITVDEVLVGNLEEVYGKKVNRFFSFPRDFWFGFVGYRNAAKLSFYLLKRRNETLFFTGRNEWRHLFILIQIVARIKNHRLIAIDYNWKMKDTIWHKINDFIFSLIKSRNTFIFQLDERIPNNPGVGFIPDPILLKNISHKNKIEKSKNKTKVKILFIGRQTDRKGLNQLVKLHAEYPELFDKYEFHVHGKLEMKDLETVAKLKCLIGNDKIKHTENYLSSKELLVLMQSSTFVCLPYAPTFLSSSGVLNDAVQSDALVLATSHGLIGYRVEAYGLGYTFDHDHIKGFYDAINLSIENAGQVGFKQNRNKYRNVFSDEKFVKTIKGLVEYE